MSLKVSIFELAVEKEIDRLTFKMLIVGISSDNCQNEVEIGKE